MSRRNEPGPFDRDGSDTSLGPQRPSGSPGLPGQVLQPPRGGEQKVAEVLRRLAARS